MAGKIKILDPLLASKIAAGEVVERPASVVKELIENSIDAGASIITVVLAEGGKRLIRVADNGEGMSREDTAVAFHRHSTSKVSSEEDLLSIKTLGFRGEALASISSVARVRLRTRARGETIGTEVAVDGGSEPVADDYGGVEGTTIEVSDLFYNTPARLKFLRSTESEYGRVLDVFKRIAIMNPDISFRLIHGSSKAIDTKAGTLKERIIDLFRKEAVNKIIEVNNAYVAGFIGTFELSYPTAKAVYTYVNGRWVRDKGINRAIIDGYGTMLAPRYPFAILNIKVPHEDVDVNIHPAKSEVRFKNPGSVYYCVKASIKGALCNAAAGPPPGAAAHSVHYASIDPPRRSLSAHEQSVNIAAGPGAFFFKEVRARGEEDLKNPEFLHLRTVGQLWGEFLVAESVSRPGAGDDGFLYIIEQHGAEERAAFERLKKDYFSASELKSQMLLLPERIETTPGEREAMEMAGSYLKRFGFEVTPFGPSTKAGGETFMIKSVPDILSSGSSERLVLDLAEELSGMGGSSRVEEVIEDALMRIACHSVIRGPRHLSHEEGDALLRKLAEIDFALHCPHGRPVVKKISRREIELMFKR